MQVHSLGRQEITQEMTHLGLPIATELFRTLAPIRLSQWPQTLPFEFLVNVETDPFMHIYAGKVLKIHFLSMTFWMW